MKAYKKNRRQTDPVYKLQIVFYVLASVIGSKAIGRPVELNSMSGCTYKELLDHLESQFEEGMTWENQGEWHIDHIQSPVSFRSHY